MIATHESTARGYNSPDSGEWPLDDRIDAWTNDDGDVLSVHCFDLPPDLPAALDEGPALRETLTHWTAQAGGGLIEALVKRLGELPALRQILKLPLPHQAHGQVFIGSFTVPRQECSTVVKIQALERGTTGTREAVVMAQVGPEAYVRPHPYAPDVQGGLPFHAADHARWDAEFPGHPLTRVRRTLDALAEAVTPDPSFASLPPFTGPALRGPGVETRTHGSAAAPVGRGAAVLPGC